MLPFKPRRLAAALGAEFRNNADGNQDFGYSATGTEQPAETYYGMRLNKQLELTPDFQLIRQPGGDKLAAPAKVFGLRAKASF